MKFVVSSNFYLIVKYYFHYLRILNKKLQFQLQNNVWRGEEKNKI